MGRGGGPPAGGGSRFPESFPTCMSWGRVPWVAAVQVRVQSWALCFPLHADPFDRRLQHLWRRLQSPVQHSDSLPHCLELVVAAWDLRIHVRSNWFH